MARHFYIIVIIITGPKSCATRPQLRQPLPLCLAQLWTYPLYHPSSTPKADCMYQVHGPSLHTVQLAVYTRREWWMGCAVYPIPQLHIAFCTTHSASKSLIASLHQLPCPKVDIVRTPSCDRWLRDDAAKRSIHTLHMQAHRVIITFSQICRFGSQSFLLRQKVADELSQRNNGLALHTSYTDFMDRWVTNADCMTDLQDYGWIAMSDGRVTCRVTDKATIPTGT